MNPPVPHRPWSKRVLWTVPACVAVVACVMTMGPYAELTELARDSGGVLDEVPRESAAALDAHIASIGERGRELYRAHFWWDVPFLLANAVALAALIGVALSRAGARPWVRRGALVVPVLAAGFDVIENALVRAAVEADVVRDSLSSALALATGAKMACFTFGALVAVGSVVSWATVAQRRRRRLARTGALAAA